MNMFWIDSNVMGYFHLSVLVYTCGLCNRNFNRNLRSRKVWGRTFIRTTDERPLASGSETGSVASGEYSMRGLFLPDPSWASCGKRVRMFSCCPVLIWTVDTSDWHLLCARHCANNLRVLSQCSYNLKSLYLSKACQDKWNHLHFTNDTKAQTS